MNTTLIATNPAEMVSAQSGLVKWCEDKLSALRSEQATAHGIVAEMKKAGLSDARGRRAITSVNRRITFYAKVKMALEAGYYILPPFPVEAFAIRIAENASTPADESTNTYRSSQSAEALPAGEGKFVGPHLGRRYLETRDELSYDKKPIKKDYYENVPVWKEAEFPVHAVRPELIQATGKALAEKIFDTIAIFRRQKDPLIVGQIKHWKKYHEPLTFFVAWWVDTETL